MNEQPGLASMHTVFVRLHNYFEHHLAENNPGWIGDELYQVGHHSVMYVYEICDNYNTRLTVDTCLSLRFTNVTGNSATGDRSLAKHRRQRIPAGAAGSNQAQRVPAGQPHGWYVHERTLTLSYKHVGTCF